MEVKFCKTAAFFDFHYKARNELLGKIFSIIFSNNCAGCSNLLEGAATALEGERDTHILPGDRGWWNGEMVKWWIYDIVIWKTWEEYELVVHIWFFKILILRSFVIKRQKDQDKGENTLYGVWCRYGGGGGHYGEGLGTAGVRRLQRILLVPGY